jgi:hypothetical protein
MDDVQPEPLEPGGGSRSGAAGAAAEGGGAGGGGQPVSMTWVAAVAREVIFRLAPQELAVFDAMADRWLSGDVPRRKPGRMPGAAVGFGVDAVLLSEVVFPVITVALGEVLGTSAVERIRPRRRSARSRAAPQVTPPEAGAGTAGDRPGEDVKLTGQQAHDLHDACRRHAMTLGLPPATAELLADAVVGALHSSPKDP